MKAIIAYHIVITAATLTSFYHWHSSDIILSSILIGCLGGVLYCLRALYIHKSVQKNFDKAWTTWYYLRPLTSAISGLIGFVFLKAGLLVLNSAENAPTPFIFYAVAFLAGYNVDNFLKRIEEISKATLNVKPSNSKDQNGNP